MSNKTKTALVRFGRVLVAGVIGVVASALPGLISGLDLPQAYQPIIAVVLTAVITGLDKLARYEEGQQDGPPR